MGGVGSPSPPARTGQRNQLEEGSPPTRHVGWTLQELYSQGALSGGLPKPLFEDPTAQSAALAPRFPACPTTSSVASRVGLPALSSGSIHA